MTVVLVLSDGVRAALGLANQRRVNFKPHPAAFQGRTEYRPWSRYSVGPRKSGPVGEVPAAETHTNGAGPVKLPPSSCSGNASNNF